MFKKITMIMYFVIFTAFLFTGCGNEVFPEAITLEDSLKEIILSKGENYNFLDDELFISKLDEYANELIKSESLTAKHYAIGNLDDDNIPELVVFIERNPKNVDDQGGLGVYKFTGERYELLDKVGMNYDNTNYILEIGKISPNQNGILLSNQVGSHSGVIYGFIVENGKLKSILNDKKISLISVNTNNEIKDMDGDGILEFSIYTTDPEAENANLEDSDKLILWYKWDEKDSSRLVKVEKDTKTNKNQLMSSKNEIDINEIPNDNLIDYLIDNKQQFDNDTLTNIIENHVKFLNESIDSKNAELSNILRRYNTIKTSEKYDLSIERLNDIEYLKRETILKSETDLKDNLINNLNMGYRLDLTDEIYRYRIDYQKLLSSFGDNINKQFKDYLKIKALNMNEPYLKGGSLNISLEKLAERIVELEKYKLTYPYSKYLDEVNEIYKSYILSFLFGSEKTPTYDLQTKKFNEKLLPIFLDIANNNEQTYFSDVIKDFLNNLVLNSNLVDSTIRANIINSL